MAIFSKSTPKKAKMPKKVTVSPNAGARVLKSSRGRGVSASTGRTSDVLRAPWLSEKALIATERGVYVFAIPEKATKYDVAAAVTAIYKVTPKKVNIVNLPAKLKMMRTRRGLGKQSVRRKAYVFLQAGDTIQFA
ncbi:MAG: 50S ribosomal protein L23 [bacterium]